MLVCLLAVALAQEPAPQPDEHAAIRQWLIQQYQEADQLLASYEDDLVQMAEPPEPMLGMRLATVNLGGRPRWRATMVTGILPGSPAAAAGLREGDRISAIGKEWLDHETGTAVLLYLADHPDTVRLLVERDRKYLHLHVRRHVIPCLAAGHQKFDVGAWKDRFARLRLILADQASALPALTTMEGFEFAFTNLKSASTLGAQMLNDIGAERGLLTAVACIP